MINLLLTGATGKMGKQLRTLAAADPAISSIIGFASEKNPIDHITNDKNDLKNINAIIDFSTSSLLDTILDIALAHSSPLVIGTTGYSESQLNKIQAASKSIPILHSPNMSIGVNKFALILEYASRLLNNTSKSILEIHHTAKLDAPSGTAKMMADIMKPDEISHLRVGNVIGEHQAIFGLDMEVIKLSHQAIDRSIFARGALSAMHFLQGKKPKVYTMRDMLTID